MNSEKLSSDKATARLREIHEHGTSDLSELDRIDDALAETRRQDELKRLGSQPIRGTFKDPGYDAAVKGSYTYTGEK